jgi:D-serine deaminase-like pyridoxal phosphate-dependent protein
MVRIMVQPGRSWSDAAAEVGIESDRIETPRLLLEVDRLDRNIERMAQLAADAGVSLRPHAKTHKLLQVADRQVAAGCAGLTVAKLGEAELFARHGIGDLFVAYPVWGAGKWRRLCDLAAKARIRVGADSREVFEGIAEAASSRGLVLPVRIEVDTGFGRCGVQTAGEARALARKVSELRGVELVGLMSFAGQMYREPPARRRDAAVADAARLVEVADDLRSDGFDIREVSIGSTPSAPYVRDMPGITELRPGTYVFSDRDQAALGWGTLEDCALTILATVVSRPTPTRAVIDAGTKTLSSDQASAVEGWGDLRGHPDWRLVSLSEEHGVLEVPPGPDGPAIGTTVEIIPNHACGALNLHDEVTVVRGTVVEDVWSVAGRGLVR